MPLLHRSTIFPLLFIICHMDNYSTGCAILYDLKIFLLINIYIYIYRVHVASSALELDRIPHHVIIGLKITLPIIFDAYFSTDVMTTDKHGV